MMYGPKVVVVVFTLENCPACMHYKPRFRRIASAYSRCVPIVMADVNDPRFTALADRLAVREVPATFVLRRPHGVLRLVGNVPDDQIRWLLDLAVRESRCPL